MKPLLLVTTYTLFCTAAQAQEEKPVEYDVPVMPYYCTPSAFGDVCQHMVGGRKTRIALPAMPDEPCAHKTVQLHQLSDKLSMPVGEPVVMPCSMAVLDIPAVKERTYFRVMLERKKGEEDAADAARDAVIAVYPQESFSALKEWSEKNHLVVVDRKQKLTPFLDKYSITYSAVKLPEVKNTTQQTLCLFVPASAEDTLPPQECASLLILHEGIDEFPQVVSVPNNKGTRLDVFIPLLPTLESHPLTQRMFIKLIESSLQGALL